VIFVLGRQENIAKWEMLASEGKKELSTASGRRGDAAKRANNKVGAQDMDGVD
jgi:hypothetical protein